MRLKLAPANFKLEFFILVFIIIMLKSNDYVISDLFIRSFIIINYLNNAMISLGYSSHLQVNTKHYELNDCLECDVYVFFPSSYFLKLANFSNFI